MKFYSYTTLKYGMLINQNHELSIKVKKKTDTISHLQNMLNQRYDIKNNIQGTSSQYQNDEESFTSDFK